MKKAVIFLCAIITCLALTGCGSIYDKEYVSVKEYKPTEQSSQTDDGKIKVRDYHALKQTIRDMVDQGDKIGTILFESDYEGEPSADMASACWEVQTKDALCAYCVENIAYELSRILTNDEAKVFISYMESGSSIDKIIRINFSTDIERILKESMEREDSSTVILAAVSALSAEDVKNLVSDVYRSNPVSFPKEPTATVNMFSGNNMQRLYDIKIDYGASEEELSVKKAELDEFIPFNESETYGRNELSKATLAFEYLKRSCTLTPAGTNNTVYSSLIEKKGDSEGIALGFVALCNKLGLECKAVYGQYNRENHCWNMVKLGDRYYHVDVSKGKTQPDWTCFICGDEQFWQNYRWDVTSYPKCGGAAA